MKQETQYQTENTENPLTAAIKGCYGAAKQCEQSAGECVRSASVMGCVGVALLIDSAVRVILHFAG